MEVSNGSAVRRSFICTANAKNIFKMNVQTGLDRSLNGQKRETMSSLQIAEITGKRHHHVMRDIKTLLAQGVQETNFGLSFKITQLHNGGRKKVPFYELTKKGCLLLATGYDAKLREKLIDRWEELENQQRMEQSRELLDMMREVTKRIANLKKYNIFALDYYNIYSWAKSTKLFEQDKMGAHYGGGLETVRSHKRPAYVVIVTPTVGFFFSSQFLSL